MGVIYKTTNIVNGKIYVGKRIFSKEKFIRSKYYGSGKLLKNAIVKYGIENFEREIIEEVENILLVDREIYWIDYYKSTDMNIGYNLSKGGNCAIGRKCGPLSDETKKKLRDSAINQFKKGGHPRSGKSVSNETKDKIRIALLGKRLGIERVEKSAKSHRGLKYNKTPKPPKIKIDQSKKVIQLTMNDEIIRIWESMTEASKLLSIDRSGISRACNGSYKQCGGYKWKYSN